jgi:hypothetical protein
MKTLTEIANHYRCLDSDDVYSLGGGLADGKYASIRHEAALRDKGKLTFGKACQLFKKATGKDLDFVKEVIRYAVPNMEWHHAGSYNGYMTKTYFLNSYELANLAEDWEKYAQLVELKQAEEKAAEHQKRCLDEKRLAFLQANAQYIERSMEQPPYFVETKREMNGRYGWFDCTGKPYNLPIYFSGWKFEKEEDYLDYIKII